MPLNKDADRDSCYLVQAINFFKHSDTGRHIRNARREMLLAAKSLIDICLDKLEEKNAGEKEEGQAHKVEIK